MVIKMAIRTLDQLNDELIDLKSCQIDILKMSIAIFTFVSIFLGGLAGAILKPDLNFADIDQYILLLFVLFVLVILGIAPITFPLFMRIILHKCRSIFRLMGYIRFCEESTVKDEKNVIPYELGYSVIRGHPILRGRLPKHHGLINFYFEKPWSVILEIFTNKNWKTIDKKKHKIKLRYLYTGRYFSNIWFFMRILAAIHIILALSISVIFILYGIQSESTTIAKDINLVMTSWPYNIVFFYDLILLAWCLYNHRLINRYFKEIHYYPFSIKSWYLLFKIANKYFFHEDTTILNKLLSPEPDEDLSELENEFAEDLTKVSS